MRGIWYPNRTQLASAVKSCQIAGIPTVCLDAIARLFRDQRGSDDDADMACGRELPLNAIAAGSCFIAKSQRPPWLRKLCQHAHQGRWRVYDLAKRTHVTTLAAISKRATEIVSL